MIDQQIESLPVIKAKQGATRPAWVVTCVFDDNSALSLTGASYAGKLRRLDGADAVATAGSYATTTAVSGIFTYSPHADDVDQAGTYLWQTTITISGETYIRTALVEIEEAL